MLSRETIERLPLASLTQRSLSGGWPCPLNIALDRLEAAVEQEVALALKTDNLCTRDNWSGANAHIQRALAVDSIYKAAKAT